ncbi:hypothetical protein C8J55DRAFT_490583 [Lentinula edodes]|uniref:Uncharacterized protein n=1 Tax=Lentinula lateritia TaxID=40482 RepID=A0A9W9DKF3_9AGAR|nr:hypothetical protein C8J55DRAFT_490583 [Lentinula edodes]
MPENWDSSFKLIQIQFTFFLTNLAGHLMTIALHSFTSPNLSTPVPPHHASSPNKQQPSRYSTNQDKLPLVSTPESTLPSTVKHDNEIEVFVTSIYASVVVWLKWVEWTLRPTNGLA